MLSRVVLIAFATLLSACQVVDQPTDDQNKGPQVLSVSPTIDSTDQPLDAIVTVTFAQPMQANTLTKEHIIIEPMVEGELTISDDTTVLTFTPAQPLAQKTLYTVRLLEGIKDRDGNLLPAMKFEFTTGGWTGVKQFGTVDQQFFGRTAAIDYDGDIWVAIDSDVDPVTKTAQDWINGYLLEFSPLGELKRSLSLIAEPSEVIATTNISDFTIDSSGNLFVLTNAKGNFPENPSIGTEDAVIFKFNKQLEQQWIYRVGGTNATTIGTSIYLDSYGAPFVYGTTTGVVDDSLQSKIGDVDIFVSKVYEKLDAISALQLGATNAVMESGGIVAKDGFIYISGNTNADYDNTGTHTGVKSAFLTKLTTELNEPDNNSIVFGGAGLTVEPKNLLIDRDGYLVVAGKLTGNGSLHSKPNPGNSSTFFSQFDIDFNHRITVVHGEAGKNSGADAIIQDSHGNFYATGTTDSVLSGNTSSDKNDAFIIKFDMLFHDVWVKQLGDISGHTYGMGMAINESGDVFVVGDTTAKLNESSTQGIEHAFVAKLKASGELQ